MVKGIADVICDQTDARTRKMAAPGTLGGNETREKALQKNKVSEPQPTLSGDKTRETQSYTQGSVSESEPAVHQWGDS